MIRAHRFAIIRPRLNPSRRIRLPLKCDSRPPDVTRWSSLCKGPNTPVAMRVLTIIPNDQLSHALAEELTHIPDIQLARSLPAFSRLDELLQTIRIHRPDLLFVWVEDLPKVEATLASLADLMPGLQLIGVAHHIDEELAHHLMQLGLRDYLVTPFTHNKLKETLAFVQRQLKRYPSPVSRLADLYTFFPAKPGVGTTTIALSVSCALAEELSVRALLMDCDLAAGMVNFHLKLGNSASVVDAISHAENLDEDLWRQLIGKSDKLDVLHGGNLISPPRIDPASLQRVLDIARAQYEVICADLGSDLNEFSIELLRESQRIFLITTPEVAPVHLAKARAKSLGDLGLADRVSLVLNRKDHWRGHLETAVVAEAVGVPVAYCIGNDYDTCAEAVVRGTSIPGASDIGRQILNLAQSLRADSLQKTPPTGHGRRFLEFFHISHVEDPTTVWHG